MFFSAEPYAGNTCYHCYKFKRTSLPDTADKLLYDFLETHDDAAKYGFKTETVTTMAMSMVLIFGDGELQQQFLVFIQL